MATCKTRTAGALLLLFSATHALDATAAGPTGAFDTSWGFSAGKSQLPFDLGTAKSDAAAAAVQASDGSFYIAGTVTGADNLDHIGIAKLSPSGKIDTSFSGDSRNVSITANLVATGVALSPDETRIFVSGYSTANGSDYDMVVCQFSAVSGANISFPDNNNIPCVSPGSFPGDQDIANDIVVQTDGKIVIGGTVGRNSPANTYAAFARFNADGKPDAQFGNVLGKPGLTLIRNDAAYTRHAIRAIAIASNGKIVGVGDTVLKTAADLTALVLRIDATGKADGSELAFQRDGSGTRDTVLNDVVAVDDPLSADDALVVVGGVELSVQAMAGMIGKVRSSLSVLDAANFGDANGVTSVAFADDTLELNSVARQDGGKFLASGTRFLLAFPYTVVDVMRFGADGTLDGSFGIDPDPGHTLIDFGTDAGLNVAAGLTVRGNEGVYIAAYAHKTEQNPDFFAAKLVLDTLFSDGFED